RTHSSRARGPSTSSPSPAPCSAVASTPTSPSPTTTALSAAISSRAVRCSPSRWSPSPRRRPRISPRGITSPGETIPVPRRDTRLRGERDVEHEHRERKEDDRREFQRGAKRFRSLRHMAAHAVPDMLDLPRQVWCEGAHQGYHQKHESTHVRHRLLPAAPPPSTHTLAV